MDKATTTKPKAPVKKAPAKPEAAAPKPKPKYVFAEGLTLREAADKLGLKPRDLEAALSAKGVGLELGDPVDQAETALIAQISGADIEFLTYEKAVQRLAKSDTANLLTRPPVVTIMGHVDHGKTTLLDAIRSSNLVDKESGGITQHIGAYRVVFNNRPITFVDTPGHEAFTQLRARGASVTDIVVLVIAADDGIMPQTKEAISHARAAGVPIIVAINKVDKPDANVDRVKQQLSKEGLLVEDWGGQTISVQVSAKEKKNIGELLEMILLLADVVEIKANRKVPAQGVILEARLDPQKGPLATVIVQHGILTTGESFVSGLASGKVRALFDESGRPIKRAEPSMPVEVMGFSGVPVAGDYFQVVPDAEAMKKIIAERLGRIKNQEQPKPERFTLDELFKKIEGGDTKDLPLVIKADVQGSVEVLRDILPSLGSEKIRIRIIHASTGNITESDVLLASASNGLVIGYNTKPSQKVQDLAKVENVEIRSYDIIYKLTEDIEKALTGLLEPVEREVYQGRIEIRRVFEIPKIGSIAGCYVLDGRVNRNSLARVMRGQEVVHEGRITSLKRLKENVTEVTKGFECGIGLEKFKDMRQGDIIVAFQKEKSRPI